MKNERIWYLSGMLPAFAASSAHAAPIEGEIGSNAAVVLVLLGIWALLMGTRNLRELRHKRLEIDREPPYNGHDLENLDPKGHN